MVTKKKCRWNGRIDMFDFFKKKTIEEKMDIIKTSYEKLWWSQKVQAKNISG